MQRGIPTTMTDKMSYNFFRKFVKHFSSLSLMLGMVLGVAICVSVWVGDGGDIE